MISYNQDISSDTVYTGDCKCNQLDSAGQYGKKCDHDIHFLVLIDIDIYHGMYFLLLLLV